MYDYLDDIELAHKRIHNRKASKDDIYLKILRNNTAETLSEKELADVFRTELTNLTDAVMSVGNAIIRAMYDPGRPRGK